MNLSGISRPIACLGLQVLCAFGITLWPLFRVSCSHQDFVCSVLSIVYVLGMIASENRKSTEYALLPSIGIISERDSLDLINSQVLHAIWDSRHLLDFDGAEAVDDDLHLLGHGRLGLLGAHCQLIQRGAVVAFTVNVMQGSILLYKEREMIRTSEVE